MGLTTDDVIAITQLYARYNHTVDDGDGKGFAACFTPEGVLQIGPGDPVSGREALDQFACNLPTTVPGIRHHATNLVVDGNGAEATGSAYLLVVVSGAQPTTLMTGRYRDDLTRHGGEWVFARRHLEPDA